MPDESAIIIEFIYARLVANAALVALLPRGTDAIDAYTNPVDWDDFFIVISKEGGTDQRVVNRAARRERHVASGDVDVYGPKGSIYDDIKPIIKQVDLSLEGKEGHTADGYVESCERAHLWPLPEYESGLLIPRTKMRFDVVVLS